MTQQEEPNRYWLSFDGETWREVSEDEWCNAEAGAGFHGGRPATAGFSSTLSGIQGHMHYGWSEWDCEYGPCA